MLNRRVLWISLYAAVLLIGGTWWFFTYVASPIPDVSQPPDEKDRVSHPSGFSIIMPRKMRADIYQDPDRITLLPDGGSDRYTIGVHVRRLPDDLDLQKLRAEGFADGMFQDQPALVYIGPSGSYHAWRAAFNREDRWYQLSLSFPQGWKPPVMPPPEWVAYLNTFRVEQPQDSPATRPAR